VAKASYAETLENQQRVLGPEQPDTVDTRNELADLRRPDRPGDG
jgi:hypothetical protein